MQYWSKLLESILVYKLKKQGIFKKFDFKINLEGKILRIIIIII